jgi:hypothetical protein
MVLVHSSLQADLLRSFGGFSVTEKIGAWKDSETGKVYREKSAHYEIAADWTPEQESALTALASYYCAIGEQICVLVTRANGESEFVEPNRELYHALRTMRAQKLAA